MRELWRATALIAENSDGIVEELKAVAAQSPREDLLDNVQFSSNTSMPKLQVKAQASIATLQAIDEILKRRGLILCAYELAEINRWVSRDNATNGARLAPLFDYWNRLTTLAGTGAEGFQQAAGAMSFDQELRMQVKLGKRLKEDFGFDVTPDEHDRIKAALDDTQLEDAAKAFFADTWSSTTCLGVRLASPGWIHFNA